MQKATSEPYSLITAWSFLRHRRADPNHDPNAETTGQCRADTVDRPPSRKCAKAPEGVAAQRFPALIVSSHAGGHWFESSSLHQEKPWNHNGSEVFSLPFSGRKEPLCLRYLGVFSGNFGASCCKSVANFFGPLSVVPQGFAAF